MWADGEETVVTTRFARRGRASPTRSRGARRILRTAPPVYSTKVRPARWSALSVEEEAVPARNEWDAEGKSRRWRLGDGPAPSPRHPVKGRKTGQTGVAGVGWRWSSGRRLEGGAERQRGRRRVIIRRWAGTFLNSVLMYEKRRGGRVAPLLTRARLRGRNGASSGNLALKQRDPSVDRKCAAGFLHRKLKTREKMRHRARTHSVMPVTSEVQTGGRPTRTQRPHRRACSSCVGGGARPFLWLLFFTRLSI